MKHTFVKSTLILTVATLISKILGSIFRIPLQNIAGDEVLGIFSLVYPVYMVTLTLSVAGIPIAISKLISEARAHHDEGKIKQIFTTARILALLFGFISFAIIYIFSHQIAHVLGGESTRLALVIVSTTLFVAPYMAVYRGFYQGYEDMRPTAFSQVLEQFVRVALILSIAYVLVAQEYTNEIVAAGVMIGSPIGALFSLIYLFILYRKSSLSVMKQALSFQQFQGISKNILKISLPICVGAITMALLNFIDSVTIPNQFRAIGNTTSEINYLYGIYGRGLALVQIATVASTSIVLPIIPLITKSLAKNKKKETKNIIVRAYDLIHLLSWPAAFGLLALTLPLNLGLFTNLEGSTMLAIIGFSSLFTSLTILGTGILQGMNASNLAALIIIAGAIGKIFLNLIFIRSYGLIGAALATLIIYLILCIVNLFFIRRLVHFPIWKRSTWVVAFSSFIMGLCVGLPTLYLDVAQWSRWQSVSYVVIATLIGFILYAVLLIRLKGVDHSTIKSLPGGTTIVQKLTK